MSNDISQHPCRGRLDDPMWRLHHLYWIENKTSIDKRDTTGYKKHTKKFTTEL